MRTAMNLRLHHQRPSMATPKQSRNPLLLPADIEYSILLRLPVKSLTRFKSVCKSWSSLISSPQFHQHHYHHHSQNIPLLLIIRNEDLDLRFSTYHNTKDGTLIRKFPCPLLHIDNYFFNYRNSIQSCQGLVCLPCWLSSQPILICNPATQEMTALPPCEGFGQCVGLGYSASSHELRVVRFFCMDAMGDESYCKVFSLGGDDWRESTAPPYLVNQGSAPFLHGSFHLLPCHSYGVRQEDYIAAFDIESEEYRGIQFPADYYECYSRINGNNVDYSLNIVRLTELGGSLCLAIDMSATQGLVMWLLKDYANAGWVKAYNIDFSIVGYPRYHIWSYPVGMMGDGSILVSVLKHNGKMLLCYDPRDGTVSLKIDKECSATFYVESFKCLGTR